MTEAKQFFSDELLSDIKSMELSNNPEKALLWEMESVSDYSPSVVHDNENIARLLFAPLHYDTEKNEVKPSAYSDVFNKGLSTNRLSMTNESKMYRQGVRMANEAKMTRSNRFFIGYMEESVSADRN